MKMRKIVAIVAAALMLFSILPISAMAAETTITFELGANGTATHADGTSKPTYTETVSGYTLNITGGTNMYTGARDAKGNGCIKLGTSSKAGSFTISNIPADVTSVIINVAGYKAKTATMKINNTTNALSSKSDNGTYDAITVDTSTTKTVSVAVSSGYRAMVNSISFVVNTNACTHENVDRQSICVDGVCEDCGETIPGIGHAFDNDYDADCNNGCGFTREVEEAPSYIKASELNIGDTVALVIESKKMELGSVDGIGNGVAYTDAPIGVYPLSVVAGSASGTYAFKTPDGKYLNWSSGNSLNTATTVSVNSSWKVTFDSGNAIILNAKDNTRKLQWNVSNPRFACYTSAQTAVQLYKKAATGSADCDHDSLECGDKCDECGYIEECEFDNNCDNECNKCEGPNPNYIEGHDYTNKFDGTCNVCGATREVTLPAADSTLSYEDATALGLVFASDAYTEDKFYMTGEIVATYGDKWATYGNFYIADEDGNQFLIYGLYSEDGTIRYDAMEDQPVIGDTITVYGVIGNFNGTAQMKSGWLIPAEVECEHEYAYNCSTTCKLCGEETRPEASHSYFDACSAICLYCNEETREVSHNVIHVEAAAPTCTATGNLEFWYCDVCGMAWLDEACTMNTNMMAVKLPMAEHTYFDDCSPICDVCGYEREVSHNVIHVEAKDATCTDMGNIEYWYCDVCGAAWLDAECIMNTNLRSVTLPMAEHEYYYACDAHCKNCGEKTNPHAKHNVIHVEAVEATCTATGNIEYWYCDLCHTVWSDADLMRLTNMMSVKTFKDHEYFSDCDAHCMNCGEMTRPEAGHNVIHVEAVAPTCTAMGNLEFWYCDVCGMAWLNEACTMNTNMMAVKLPAAHTFTNDNDAMCNVEGCGEFRNIETVELTIFTFQGNSVSEYTEEIGYGLAFSFEMNLPGIAVNAGTNVANYDNASINGDKVIGVGAYVSNGNDTQKVPAVYLCDFGDANGAANDMAIFAVRVINIPDGCRDREITAWAYYELEGGIIIENSAAEVNTYNNAIPKTE